MALLKGTVKTALKLVLLLPLMLLVLWVNYFVDQTGLFRGGKYELELAQILLGGDAVSNFSKMDEREVLKLYIKNMPEAYDTLVVGSSRGLQITAAIAGETGTFYNAGMSGEDFYDVVGTVALLDKYDRLPKNMILVLDPWILNDNVDSYSKRSDADLANEFLSETLGFHETYEAQDRSQYTEALLDLDYFQKNVAYYFEDHSDEDQPSRVSGNVYEQTTETKMADGTLLYTREYRENSQEWVDFEALTLANGEALPFGFYDFVSLDERRCAELEALVEYLQNKNVEVTFVLSPFHPLVYNRFSEDENACGVLLAETFWKELASRCRIPVYGSYDPEQTGCTNEDFYDGLHVRRESIKKFFFGIHASLV